MKKAKISIFISILVLIFLTVLHEFYVYKVNEKQPIPNINSFSDTELEQRENKLPKLDRAVLYVDGKQQEIKKDDKRLIRLLNFLTYSEEGDVYGLWSRLLDYNNYKDDIENGDRLEIFFKDVKSIDGGWDFIMYDRFVVKGNEVWLLQSDPQYELFNEENIIGLSKWLPYGGKGKDIDNMNFLVEAGFIN